MREFIDLERYPLDQTGSAEWQTLVNGCQKKLAEDGLFNLPRFILQDALDAAVNALKPILSSKAFTHARQLLTTKNPEFCSLKVSASGFMGVLGDSVVPAFKDDRKLTYLNAEGVDKPLKSLSNGVSSNPDSELAPHTVANVQYVSTPLL